MEATAVPGGFKSLKNKWLKTYESKAQPKEELAHQPGPSAQHHPPPRACAQATAARSQPAGSVQPPPQPPHHADSQLHGRGLQSLPTTTAHTTTLAAAQLPQAAKLSTAATVGAGTAAAGVRAAAVASSAHSSHLVAATPNMPSSAGATHRHAEGYGPSPAGQKDGHDGPRVTGQRGGDGSGAKVGQKDGHDGVGPGPDTLGRRGSDGPGVKAGRRDADTEVLPSGGSDPLPSALQRLGSGTGVYAHPPITAAAAAAAPAGVARSTAAAPQGHKASTATDTLQKAGSGPGKESSTAAGPDKASTTPGGTGSGGKHEVHKVAGVGAAAVEGTRKGQGISSRHPMHERGDAGKKGTQQQQQPHMRSQEHRQQQQQPQQVSRQQEQRHSQKRPLDVTAGSSGRTTGGQPGGDLPIGGGKRLKKEKPENHNTAGTFTHELPPLASKGSGNRKGVQGAATGPGTGSGAAVAGDSDARMLVKKPSKERSQQGHGVAAPAVGVGGPAGSGPMSGPLAPAPRVRQGGMLPGSDSGTQAKVGQEANNNSSSAAASQRGDRDSQTHTQQQRPQQQEHKQPAKPPDVKLEVPVKTHSSQQQSGPVMQGLPLLMRRSRAVPVQQAASGGAASALGLLNVMEYSSYEQLYAALTRILAAQASSKGLAIMPKLVYRDGVGDWLMLSPDEPWGLFQSTVQAIMIM